MFSIFLPRERLRPFVRQIAVSENNDAGEYKVLPPTGLVVGFQYNGHLALVQNGSENRLSGAGITGISESAKTFRNSPGIGSVLVYFTETGFAHFSARPAHELFNLSVSLDDVFDKASVAEVSEKLGLANSAKRRVKIVEQFLLSQLKDIQADRLVVEAMRLIYQSKGQIRTSELNEKLFISQSPLEKRFRKVVGTTPKKFASIVRMNTVVNSHGPHEVFDPDLLRKQFFRSGSFYQSLQEIHWRHARAIPEAIGKRLFTILPDVSLAHLCIKQRRL